MTAVDVDALDKLREAATAGLWSALENVGVLDDSNDPERDRAYLNAAIAAVVEPLLAEVRRGRALREAVEGLAEDHEKWARVNAQLAREDTAGIDLHDGMRMAQESTAERLRVVLVAVGGGQR